MDIDKLISAVRGLALKSPNNVYVRPAGALCCSNVKGTCTDGSVGCIIGQAIRIVDPTFEFINDLEECSIRSNNKPDSLLSNKLGFDHGSDKLMWLKCVQRRQDKGDTWCEAVKYADSGRVI